MLICLSTFAEICLQPDTIGGIEDDSPEVTWPPHHPLDAVDSMGHKEMAPLSVLLNGSCPSIHTTSNEVSSTYVFFFFIEEAEHSREVMGLK